MMHTVRQGESIPSIACDAGLFPDTLWDHPRNAALKALRRDMNVLAPGDQVFVPEKTARSERAATDQAHKFKRRGVPCLVRLQLFNVETPRAGEAYRLLVDGVERQGRTSDAGVLEAWVAPNAKTGTLIIGPDQARIELKFGHMDPQTEDEDAGLHKRLANLGYLDSAAPVDADATRAALLSLQRRFGLAQSGRFDGPTRDVLARCHDRADLFPPDPWLQRS